MVLESRRTRVDQLEKSAPPRKNPLSLEERFDLLLAKIRDPNYKPPDPMTLADLKPTGSPLLDRVNRYIYDLEQADKQKCG